MKKLSLCLIITLLSALFLPTAASAASDFSVDYLDVTAELMTDGSAVVTEEWTVTFSEGADGFSREIIIPEDNLETFASVSDVSVSVDGNGCNLDTDGTKANGTYAFEKGEDRYIIRWNNKCDEGTYEFSLRYVLNGVVKIYEDHAYFYCTAVNAESSLVCRNVSVEINMPGESFSEDYKIVHSGSLAGKKADGAISFTAYNTAGEVKTGVRLPVALFDASKLPVVLNDYTTVIIVCSVSGVILLAVAAYVIYYTLNYRRLFRKKWEKKCRRSAFDESSYSARAGVFRKMSAAQVINIVAAETVSGADKFIANFLELVNRGYIVMTADGFEVKEKSDSDSTGRKLQECDRIVMKFFSGEKWSKTVKDPEKFYHFVETYNKKLGFVNPVAAFRPEDKKIIKRCFEMSISAKRHEFIPPEEISDDFIKGGKYTLNDLVASLLNEYRLSLSKDFTAPDTSKYKRNMFMLRDIYKKGSDIVQQKELELLKAKQQRKKRKTETDDDFDTE